MSACKYTNILRQKMTDHRKFLVLSQQAPLPAVLRPMEQRGLVACNCSAKVLSSTFAYLYCCAYSATITHANNIPRVSLWFTLGYVLAFPFGRRPLVRGVLKNSFTIKMKSESWITLLFPNSHQVSNCSQIIIIWTTETQSLWVFDLLCRVYAKAWR